MLKTKARTKDWDFILKDSQGPRRVEDYKQLAVLVESQRSITSVTNAVFICHCSKFTLKCKS